MKPLKTSRPTGNFSLRSTVFVGVAAFILGAGTMWLFSRDRYPSPTRLSDTKQAAEMPPDVSRLAPPDADLALANWNYDRQNWPHAIEHYQKAIALGRDNPDVRTDLGNCFRFLGEPQKALEQYETAQKQNPQHENSLFNQAGLFGEVLHDPTRAKAVARQFLDRFPQSARAEAARKLIEQPEQIGDMNKEAVREWLKTKP
jgi:tetratricopeptide (TPR) repeat protein